MIQIGILIINLLKQLRERLDQPLTSPFVQSTEGKDAPVKGVEKE
jgi:hypothetical protein